MVRSQMNLAREEMNKFANEEYSKNGSDAFGAPQRIKDQALKTSQAFSKDLRNSVQQEMFNQVFEQYASEHTLRAQNHESHQREIFTKQTRDAENQLNSEEIVANMGDAKFVQSRLKDIARNVAANNSGAGDIGVRVKASVEGVLLDRLEM